MGNTAIEWTDETWNPVRGCSRVSEGCRHCYAEQQAARIVRMGKGKPTAYDGLVKTVRLNRHPGDEGTEGRWTGVVRLVLERLSDPLRWRNPRRIFVNSMSDLFHESLSNEQIAAVFGVMAACPQHTFQILTKRAKRMCEWFQWLRGPSENTFTMQQRGIVAAPNTARALLEAAYEYLGKARKPELDVAWAKLEDVPWPLPNVWIGTSVENQDAADERIPELLATPAAVRFLSCEPLLDVVDIKFGLHRIALHENHVGPATKIDWVIAGCESGPGARPCDVAWLRSLRDQCANAGVPYFLKQAAGTRHESDETKGLGAVEADSGSHRKPGPGNIIGAPYLDGRQHLEFPQ